MTPGRPSRTKLSRRERLRIIADLKLREPLLTQSQLAKRSGIPIGTIKTDLRSIGHKNHKASPPRPPENKTGIKPAASEDAAPRFDWDAAHDRIGRLAADIAESLMQGNVICPNCGEVRPVCERCGGEVRVIEGEGEEARGWAATFGKLFAGRVMAERMTLYLRNERGEEALISGRSEMLSRRQLLDALQREDRGPCCLLCGQPRQLSGGGADANR